MRLGVAALGIACVLLAAPAFAAQSACGEIVHLSIQPVEKSPGLPPRCAGGWTTLM